MVSLGPVHGINCSGGRVAGRGRRCSSVSLIDERAAHPTRVSSPAAVTKPSGDRADVDTGRDELGRAVVAQLVQQGANAQTLRRAVVSVRCSVGDERRCAVRRQAEEVGVRVDDDAELGGPLALIEPSPWEDSSTQSATQPFGTTVHTAGCPMQTARRARNRSAGEVGRAATLHQGARHPAPKAFPAPSLWNPRCSPRCDARPWTRSGGAGNVSIGWE